MEKKIYVLYHGDKDGQAAAFAAWKKFGDDAEYISVNYGQPLPEMLNAADVFIVDFSYKKDVMMELVERMSSVTVIDHHKTAKAELESMFEHDAEPFDLVFDMSKAGCVLTWEYFFPDVPVPQLLLMVQDRDLWEFKWTETKPVHAYLCSHSFDFRVWDELVAGGVQTITDFIVPEGRAILRAEDKAVKNMCRATTMTVIDGFTVPCVNTPFRHSEVAQVLMDNHDTKFVCVYWDIKAEAPYERKRVFSLRSRGEFDVSAIAKKFGGGGHRNAAGFTVPLI